MADIDNIGPKRNVNDPKLLLRKKLETAAIQKLTQLDSNSMEQVFKDIRNSEGQTLDKKKFQEAMVKAGHKIYEDSTILDSFWEALDVNHDQAVDKKELITGLTVLTSGSLEDKLKLSFSIFDLNKDGFVQPDELRSMLRSIGKVKYKNDAELQNLVDKFVHGTFLKYDINKDGKLSFEEFATAAKESPQIGSFFTLQVSGLTDNK